MSHAIEEKMTWPNKERTETLRHLVLLRARFKVSLKILRTLDVEALTSFR